MYGRVVAITPPSLTVVDSRVLLAHSCDVQAAAPRMHWSEADRRLQPEPEPEMEVDLATQLQELVLQPAPVEANATVSRRSTTLPERQLDCQTLGPQSTSKTPHSTTLGNAPPAKPHVSDITDCCDEERAARHVNRRKGSILDLIAQLGNEVRIGSTAAVEHETTSRSTLEGFLLDANVATEPQKLLKQPEVWNPKTKTWNPLPTLVPGCAKAGSKCSRRGPCTDSSRVTTSRALLRVSLNRGSIRRSSKRASRVAGGQRRSPQSACVW